MTTRMRTSNERGSGHGDHGGTGLPGLREEAHRFADAADAIIDRTTASGDSERFLRRSRQQTGQ